MSGKHEPSSSASFWISVSTTVLRGALVVAAIALGIFVLSKAFPSASTGPTPPASETTAPEPTDTGGGGPTNTGGGGGGNQTQGQETPQIQGVKVAVLNGTGITNLAACVATEVVEPLKYNVTKVDDAQADYEVTTISYRKEFEADARYLQEKAFKKAELQRLSGGAVTDVSIALGTDAATGACANPA